MATSVVSVPARVSSRQRVHRVFRTLHLVLGLSFGLILVVQGLTGTALVWRPELERILLPHPARQLNPGAVRFSLDAELASVHQALPAAQPRMVRLATSSSAADEWSVALPEPVNATSSDGSRRTVYVDPANAHVLGVRGAQRDLLGLLIELHHTLLMGKFGRLLLGYLAIATILLAVSGLWLWWPSRWIPSRFRPRVQARPMHYALGFWSMVPLLAIATTALYLVWRQPIQKFFGVQAQHRSMQLSSDKRSHRGDRPHTSRLSRTPSPSLDAVVDIAHAAAPADTVTALRLPDLPSGSYTVLFEPPERHDRAAPDSAIVRILPDGKPQVSELQLWQRMPPAKRILAWLPRIHQAEFGGTPIRILWSLAGCTPAMLYVSGFLMWRRRVTIANQL